MTNVSAIEGRLVVPVLLVLGPLRVEGLDGGVPLGGVRPRRLLAALALQAGQAVSCDRLADVVWEGCPPRSARQNLQTYVWSLRRALARAGEQGPAIVAGAGGYLLRAGPRATDWDRFCWLSQAAARCLAADPAASAGLLAQALGLWRGRVLADVADGMPALAPQVAAMEEARLAALEQRVDAELAAGHGEQLAAELAGLAAAYPLRERFRAQRMLALYRAGRQAEAMAEFHALRALLDAELGVLPCAEVTRLYQAILRADPRLSGDGRPDLNHATIVAAGRGPAEPATVRRPKAR